MINKLEILIFDLFSKDKKNINRTKQGKYMQTVFFIQFRSSMLTKSYLLNPEFNMNAGILITIAQINIICTFLSFHHQILN